MLQLVVIKHMDSTMIVVNLTASTKKLQPGMAGKFSSKHRIAENAVLI